MQAQLLKPVHESDTLNTAQPATLMQDLAKAERDLIAALYSIWHLQGKRKKIVTVRER